MARYRLTAIATTRGPMNQDLDWTEDDYNRFRRGDDGQAREASDVAEELIGFDWWVEKIEDDE